MNEKIETLIHELNRVILGNERQITLAVICIIANGNLLIEDMPGTGKSTLSRALARGFSLKFKSVHFTNDLLPGDLIGINIYDSQKSVFRFEPGPIFSNVLLADEINRAGPRTQSALLEAMNNKEISIEGIIHKLPKPFFVIASQNPSDQIGTSPLPESQLDRFLMRISLGNTDRKAEKEILKGKNINPYKINQIISQADLQKIQEGINKIHVEDKLYDYILDLVEESRKIEYGGLSMRATKDILNAAKGYAFIQNCHFVLPDHVKFVFSSVAEHRLDLGNKENFSISEGLLKQVNAIR